MSNCKLYLFNPDNDLALANDDTNYMPPASARQMASDLALLPSWYADSGSAVLAPSAYNLAFLKEMKERFLLPVEFMTEPEVAERVATTALHPVPWGWNKALRKRLLQLGVCEDTLPTLDEIETLRTLSHRQRAVELLPRLQLNNSFCGTSSYLTDADAWQQFVESHASALLKAPLSGSGKGLHWCRGVFTPFVSGWCARVASLQGGIVAEPVYDKVEDFAMEFRADGRGSVVFAGYSLFTTGAGGAYAGNLLLSDEEIERRLSAYVSLTDVQALKLRLEQELSALMGKDYTGYLGVDMMICRFTDEQPLYRIHPCVEINLRMNMGMVARVLYDRYLHPGTCGTFSVTYTSVPGEALAEHERMAAEYPLRQNRGRVTSGYLPLVPVTGRSLYRAWVLV
ncbi:MAG: hypothetical protein KBE55_07330 [Bacteroides sp.]|uniref:hypothetical protein n=1 Tax=Bacteroides sp. TaxID=29523 RepID=UPI001B5D570E|nr:hypothetical protein [Bacteroides sp.]MBP9586687.1 hypothetical protein [Bacteroides sp.]